MAKTTSRPPVDTSASMAGAISTPMVSALEQAWAEIRSRHPEVWLEGAATARGRAPQRQEWPVRLMK
jgi:hypothetical protein